MWNLAKIFVVAAICLGGVGEGWAKTRSRPSPRTVGSKPAVRIMVPKMPLSFGRVSGPGPVQLKAETAARVAANCPFRLAAFFEGLTAAGGKRVAIPAKQMTVTINGKEVPVGTGRVAIAAGGPTPPSGVEIPIVVVVKMKGASSYPAGQYGGSLKLAVLPGS